MEAKDKAKGSTLLATLNKNNFPSGSHKDLQYDLFRLMEEYADFKTKELSTQRDRLLKANKGLIKEVLDVVSEKDKVVGLIKKYVDWVNEGPTVADISESSRVELEIINEMEGYLKQLDKE